MRLNIAVKNVNSHDHVVKTVNVDLKSNVCEHTFIFFAVGPLQEI